MAGSLQNLNFIVSLTDRVTPGIGKIMGGLNKMQNRFVSGGLKIGAGTAGLYGLNAGFDMLTKKAIAFESAMADVRKAVDFPTPDGLGKMGETLLKLSHEIPLSAEGLAQIAAEGGKMGIGPDILADYTKLTAKMAVAFEMLPDAAGKASAQLSNILHIPMNQMESMGDTINYLADKTSANAPEIVEVLTRIGGNAKNIKLANNEMVALATTMLSLGKTPEIAATGINALLNKLGSPSLQAKGFHEALDSIGLSAKDLELAVKAGPQQAINGLLNMIAKLDDQSKRDVLGGLFGQEYSDDLAILVNGLDVYQKTLGFANDKLGLQNSMTKEFQNRSATTANQLQLLSNRWDHLMINVGTIFLPMLNDAVATMGSALDPLISGLQNFAAQHPVLAKFITSFAAITGAIGVAAFIIMILAGAIGLISTPVTLIGLAVAGIAAAIMSLGGVGWVLAKWEMLRAWWQGFSIWLTVIRPFQLVYGGAVAAVQALLGVFETIRGWWGSFKGWLASLNPFGALMGGVDALVNKVMSIGSAVRSALSFGGAMPALSGGKGGLMKQISNAVSNNSNRSTTINVNNHGGAMSGSRLAGQLKMAGG